MVGEIGQRRTIIVGNDTQQIEAAIQNLDGGGCRVFSGLAASFSLQ